MAKHRAKFGWPVVSDISAVSKFAGVPKTPETISAISGPKFAILWGHVEEI